MVDRKLTMSYVAGRIAEAFQTDLFIISSEDNSELIIRCRVVDSPDKRTTARLPSKKKEDVFLRQLETRCSAQSLYGVSRTLIGHIS